MAPPDLPGMDEAALRRALARPAGQSSDFDLNPGTVLPEGRVLRPAAVLVAAWDRPGGLQVILTKRASHLKHHPGQIAFPGGKVDAQDASPLAAALLLRGLIMDTARWRRTEHYRAAHRWLLEAASLEPQIADHGTFGTHQDFLKTLEPVRRF